MIICIGREFGSGGHEIGRKVAEKLGLELYDRDLIDRAAEKIVAMPKDVLEKADEKKRNPWLHEVWYDVPNQELNGMTANEALHLAYNSIIRIGSKHILHIMNFQKKEIVYLSDAVRTIYWNKQRLIILVCLLQPRLNGV